MLFAGTTTPDLLCCPCAISFPDGGFDVDTELDLAPTLIDCSHNFFYQKQKACARRISWKWRILIFLWWSWCMISAHQARNTGWISIFLFWCACGRLKSSALACRETINDLFFENFKRWQSDFCSERSCERIFSCWCAQNIGNVSLERSSWAL